MPQRSRFDRPPAHRPFNPNDRCYECCEKGRYAYDCHHFSQRRRNRSQSRSHSRSRGRRYSCSCSRSHGRSRSATPRRSRSVSLRRSRLASLRRFRSGSIIEPGIGVFPIPLKIEIKIQVYFTTKKQLIKIQIS